MTDQPIPTAPDSPARVRMTLLVLSIGLGVLVLFAWFAETVGERAPLGAMFFLVPVVGFLLPMVLSAVQLPSNKGAVIGLALLSAAFAAATLIVCALTGITSWGRGWLALP